MTQDDVVFLRSWFENYTKRFPTEDTEVEANLRYKKEHSLRVRNYMLTLGRDLQLDGNQMFLAEVIGLFHDVGRFEQYVKYHTFKDHRSEDHAKLGLSVLEREEILSGRVSELEKEIILTSIRNHNQRVIHETVSGNTLLFCKLIRDADKLDIFEQVISFYERLKSVIFCGDLNVAHQEIDLKNPSANRKNAGFSTEERNRFDDVINNGFVDTFRLIYPDQTGAYTWWSYIFNARANNAGWRIDYFCVSAGLKDQVKNAVIYQEVLGSDHCPVGLEIF